MIPNTRVPYIYMKLHKVLPFLLYNMTPNIYSKASLHNKYHHDSAALSIDIISSQTLTALISETNTKYHQFRNY